MTHPLVPENSDCLFTNAEIMEALQKQAEKIDAVVKDEPVLVLTIMNGGMFFATDLGRMLKADCTFDYVQISRYGLNEQGGELIWKHQPDTDISGKTVLIMDDIYDEGYTVEAVKEWCESRGAAKVLCAVLVHKDHQRGYAGPGAEFVALTVPDRYVFGYGMDTEERLRHLDAIYAFKEE